MVREANEGMANDRGKGYNGLYVGNIRLWMGCYDCCFTSPMPRAPIEKDQHRWDDVHIAGSLCLSEGCKGFHMPRMLASRGMIA